MALQCQVDVSDASSADRVFLTPNYNVYLFLGYNASSQDRRAIAGSTFHWVIFTVRKRAIDACGFGTRVISGGLHFHIPVSLFVRLVYI